MTRLTAALAAVVTATSLAFAVGASGQSVPCTDPYCPAPGQTTPPTIKVLGVSGNHLTVPPKARGEGRRCAAKNFTVRATITTKNPLRVVRVYVDTRLIKTTSSKHVVARVPVKSLKKGPHRLRFRATDNGGRTSSKTVWFVVCGRAATLPARAPGFTG